MSARDLSEVDSARCEVRLWAAAEHEHTERANVARACKVESMRAARSRGATLGQLAQDAGVSPERARQLTYHYGQHRRMGDLAPCCRLTSEEVSGNLRLIATARAFPRYRGHKP